MSLLVLFGTRPEAIKLGPVVAALREAHVPLELLATGQHTTLLRGTPAETDLAGAGSLGLTSDGNIPRWLAQAERSLGLWLTAHPGVATVIVQGDTMSALAGARAAKQANRELVHIEAGVRSHDLENPWPEEGTRIEITRLADWHFAATPTAFANLLAEGIPERRIRLTGNSIVSALARYTDAKPQPPQPHILVTLHRHELVRDSARLADVLTGLHEAALAYGPVQFFWPQHPAVAESSGWLTWPENVRIMAPLPYPTAALMLASATGVLTDSGGLMEEAATLGVPCACLRHACDRPEAVEAGVAVCHLPTRLGVRQGVDALLQGTLPRRPSAVYGDPTAASQIARYLERLVTVEAA